jgi:hypothetical protein
MKLKLQKLILPSYSNFPPFNCIRRFIYRVYKRPSRVSVPSYIHSHILPRCFFNILILFFRLFLGVPSGPIPPYFHPKCTHFCVSCVLSASPISYSFACVILIMCREKDKEVELREHYAVCAWCLCVSVSVSNRSRFQFLSHLTDVHGILYGNYATGGRSNPKFPTPSRDNMADTWTCDVGGMIDPLGLGLWTYVVINVLKTSTFS